jgi:hypothetical protein
VKLIDSHCHLNYEGLVERQPQVLENAREAGVTGFLNISTRQREWDQIIAVAEREPDVWASVGVHPHEADPGGATLQLGRTFQRWQRECNAGEGALVGIGGAFLGLDDLPEVMAAMLGIAEDVRVPALHLVGNALEHVLEREQASFFGHLSVEHDLELKIAELINQTVHVVAGDRVGDFVRFFDRVGRDRVESLHAIPFAAAHGVAQATHDLDEPLKGHRGPFVPCHS